MDSAKATPERAFKALRFWETCIQTRSPICISLAVMDCFLTIAGSSADICGEDRSLQRIPRVLSVLLRGQSAAGKPTSPQMRGGCKLIDCEGLRVEFGPKRQEWEEKAI